MYVLEDTHSDDVWLVDIGSSDFSAFSEKNVRGVFITHTHIDHIQGINALVVKYPDCIIYTNQAGKEGLYNDKINLTFYHEKPLCFIGGNVQVVKEGDKVPLFDDIEMEIIETPGHHPSCVCYKAQNYLFTGDSYIPDVPVVTKLRGGSKIEAERSLIKIKGMITENSVICPGHGPIIDRGFEYCN